ncbi:hypothetical protein COU97_03045 [Candidatus Shapirobacteria bacterium CG10_big_fil_rev_8_21_14_0_10_48_15]|uniref:Penicillin-binding protein 2 n=1 Tax=Candidatus Shapirobacteria bacterium CG10_big_fil_rev_8_21_14_0_10_48_15 TaxID=1974484 RepID=A0A2M8L6L4_9BACT|nr:MAG: hypothetical protein COU97_03045 [Candidatus Shapirobacteria bacterium CG10_big_fil_rev_8_21_14_0_10_48_15]
MRIKLLLIIFFGGGILIAARLFYWQVLHADGLATAAEQQHWVSFEIPAKRGEILAQDSFPLVANQESFLLFASLTDLEASPTQIAAQIAPYLLTDQEKQVEDKQAVLLPKENLLKQRLQRQDLVWVPLEHKISLATKKALEALAIAGLGFEEEQTRSYPEASGAAHLLGFVGADVNGRDKGYFGLEGYYDLELRGRAGVMRREKDASGKPILVGEVDQEPQKDGRVLVTTIDRTVQFLLEEKLKAGLAKYGAAGGSIVVMDPRSGAILGMASLPSYDPAKFGEFDKQLYPNPAIAAGYEPGSTFKTLVMAAALDAGAVKPETRCDRCAGPRRIAEYSIETFDGQYYPDTTMTAVIEHSDNVGMIFTAEKLGLDKTYAYLQKFGLGQATGIDLEEETVPELRPKNDWRLIDLATASFGQGVAVTPLQMVRAVGAIANGGLLVQPYVVDRVVSEKGNEVIKHSAPQRVIKKTTAQVLTEMMVNAADKAWFARLKPKGFRIAGKSGTAQIPVAGHYDEGRTIGSYIGFAPADDPQFIMLIVLNDPTSSEWGANTAAPLWMEIAQELFVYYGLMPG